MDFLDHNYGDCRVKFFNFIFYVSISWLLFNFFKTDHSMLFSYGDIHPKTNNEKMITTFVMLISAVIYAR